MDEEAVAKRFAENLSRALDAAELTQEALATRAEIHRSQVSELMRGKQLPRLATVLRLAGALGIEPAQLIKGLSFEPSSITGQFSVERSS